MGGHKEIASRVQRLVEDGQHELMERLDSLRTINGLTDAEMRKALEGWSIDLVPAWDEYVQEQS